MRLAKGYRSSLQHRHTILSCGATLTRTEADIGPSLPRQSSANRPGDAVKRCDHDDEGDGNPTFEKFNEDFRIPLTISHMALTYYPFPNPATLQHNLSTAAALMLKTRTIRVQPPGTT